MVYRQVYRNLMLGLCQRIRVSPEDTRNPHGDSVGGKQVGLCPTSACSIPIGKWQFGGTCEPHGLALLPDRVISGVSIVRHPLRWDKVGGYDRDMDDQPERLGHVRGLNGSGSGLVCGNDTEQLPVFGNLRTLYRGFTLAHEIVASGIQWDFLAAVVEVFRYQFVIRTVVVAFEQLPPIGQFHFAQLLDEVD